MENRNLTRRRTPLWLKILIPILLPPLAYFILGIYYTGFAHDSERKGEKGFLRNLARGFSSMYEMHAEYLRSLPSDEEMIRHFKEHRGEFEKLVRVFREDLSVPDTMHVLEPTPAIKTIMASINVVGVWGDGVIWMPPDPYSTDPDFLKSKSRLASKWFDPERRRFSGVIFVYAHPKVRSLKNVNYVYRRYYYIPLAPRIGDGVLVLPSHLLTGDPRVVPSLNAIPTFGSFDCAYRQVEPHWFIGVCQGQ